MTPELIEKLLNEEEGVMLDFKREQYRFTRATDKEKSELLKDILAFANAWRTSDAYILIGVEEIKGGRSKIVGINEYFDDSRLQQFVNSKTNRPVDFSYENYVFEGKQLGIIRIPLQERPSSLHIGYGNLHRDRVYVRRGSSTDTADPAEIVRMASSPPSSVKPHYFKKVEPYLLRRVCRIEDAESYRLYVDKDDVTFDLATIVEHHNHVVLVCDAGTGKSVELRRLAALYSEEGARFHVEFSNLNTYVNQPVSELLCSDWRHVPEENLLIILDGFDEVEAKNRGDAVRRIESFADEHPAAHLLISSRTNFYNTSTEKYPSTLRDFKAFTLLKLDDEAVNGYAASELETKHGAFLQAARRSELHALLRLPFYLIRLVELYKERGALPPSRAGVFEVLLDSRLDHDIARSPEELRGKKQFILCTLERLGLRGFKL